MTNSSWLLKRNIFYRSDVVDESMECEVFSFQLRHLVRNLVEMIFVDYVVLLFTISCRVFRFWIERIWYDFLVDTCVPFKHCAEYSYTGLCSECFPWNNRFIGNLLF